MNLGDYWRVLRKRWKLVTACTLLCLGAAATASLLLTPLFAARVKLFVSSQASANVSSAYEGSLLSQQRVTSYSELIAGPAVTGAVAQQLGLTTLNAHTEIAAEVPVNTVLIDVTVKDPSAARAQQVANAIGQQFSPS